MHLFVYLFVCCCFVLDKWRCCLLLLTSEVNSTTSALVLQWLPTLSADILCPICHLPIALPLTCPACTAWCDFLTRKVATSDLLWFGGSVLVGCWWCLPKCPRCTAADSGLLLLTQCTAAPACLTKLLACYIAGLLYSTIDVDIFINTCLVQVLTKKVVASDYICLF